MKKEWSQQQIRGYLLGQLSQSETEELDELFVTDDELALRLQTVENDLLDSYIKGGLGGNDVDAFRNRYVAYPPRSSKIRDARIVQKLLELERERKAPRFSFSTWIPAAAILLLLLTGFLAFQNLGLRSEVNRQQAEIKALRERELAFQSQSKNEIQKPEKLIALDLKPATRGISEIPILEVPAGTDTTLFTLLLEMVRYPQYKIELRDPSTNELLWQSDAMQSAKTISIRVPAAVFGSKHYQFQLIGITANGGTEFVAGYPVAVFRK